MPTIGGICVICWVSLGPSGPWWGGEGWDPPTPPSLSKSDKTLTGLLEPTIEEGAGNFVSGGPHGPKEAGNSFILDFYCQHLRRLLFVLCLGALTGPGEFCQILRLYYVVNIMLLIC